MSRRIWDLWIACSWNSWKELTSMWSAVQGYCRTDGKKKQTKPNTPDHAVEDLCSCSCIFLLFIFFSFPCLLRSGTKGHCSPVAPLASVSKICILTCSRCFWQKPALSNYSEPSGHPFLHTHTCTRALTCAHARGCARPFVCDKPPCFHFPIWHLRSRLRHPSSSRSERRRCGCFFSSFLFILLNLILSSSCVVTALNPTASEKRGLAHIVFSQTAASGPANVTPAASCSGSGTRPRIKKSQSTALFLPSLYT